jgi:hypothetical protein
LKKTLKLTMYVAVLTLATVVAYAGPCEDSCVYFKQQCDSQASQSYAGCVASFEEEHNRCRSDAYLEYQDCAQNRPWDPCNTNLQTAEQQCAITFDSNKVTCEWLMSMDLSSCNNDYENCLFVCSLQ